MKEGRKSANTDDAQKMQEIPETPHGWIQWKGTNVCMDFKCKCGFHGHVDDWFAYHLKCPKCDTVYACNPIIELIELEVEPGQCVVTDEQYLEEQEINKQIEEL